MSDVCTAGIFTDGSIVLGSWEIPYTGLIYFVVVLAVSLIIYRIISWGLSRAAGKSARADNMVGTIKFFQRFILLLIITAAFINYLNLKSEIVNIVIGIIVTAISFACVKSLNNVIAGVYLAIIRSFTPGDFVEIDGLQGIVTEINLTYIKLMQINKDTVIIPNVKCLKANILNYSLSIPELEKELDRIKQQIEKKRKLITKSKRKGTVRILEKLKREYEDYREILSELRKVQWKFAEEVEKSGKRNGKGNGDGGESRREKAARIRMGYSEFFDPDKIVKYTFTVSLDRTPERNAEILEKVCDKWADVFEITPTWTLTDLAAKLTYTITIFTPDPYRLIKYRDAFVLDIYLERGKV